jgi:hypothetical protein
METKRLRMAREETQQEEEEVAEAEVVVAEETVEKELRSDKPPSLLLHQAQDNNLRQSMIFDVPQENNVVQLRIFLVRQKIFRKQVEKKIVKLRLRQHSNPS